MENSASPPVWQPLTFSGVASFSRASLGRLVFVQSLVAVLVAGSAVWFLSSAWFPEIQKGIGRLPDQGVIRRGQLEWTNPAPVWLAEGKFVSILVGLDSAPQLGHSTDVQFELGRREVRIRSLFGSSSVPYPAGGTIGLNRLETGSWWGAWRPFLLIGGGVAVVIGLWASWLVLATIYMVPIRLIAFYRDRAVTWVGSWRMASAALLPGALLMSGAIFLYGLQQLNLVGLLSAWLLHIVIGWIYAGVSPTRLPRLAETPSHRGNPFTPSRRRGNPFGS